MWQIRVNKDFRKQYVKVSKPLLICALASIFLKTDFQLTVTAFPTDNHVWNPKTCSALTKFANSIFSLSLCYTLICPLICFFAICFWLFPIPPQALILPVPRKSATVRFFKVVRGSCYLTPAQQLHPGRPVPPFSLAGRGLPPVALTFSALLSWPRKCACCTTSLQWPRLLSLRTRAARPQLSCSKACSCSCLEGSISEKAAPSTFLGKDINPNVRNMPSKRWDSCAVSPSAL